MKMEITFTLETITFTSESQAERYYLASIVKDLMKKNFKYEYIAVNENFSSSLILPLYREYKKP